MDSSPVLNPETYGDFRNFPAGVDHGEKHGSGMGKSGQVVKQVSAFFELHIIKDVPEQDDVEPGSLLEREEVGEQVFRGALISWREKIKVPE